MLQNAVANLAKNKANWRGCLVSFDNDAGCLLSVN